MRLAFNHRHRRGSARVPAIVIPLILVIGVGLGIVIGSGMSRKGDTAGAGDAANGGTANVKNVANVPMNINAGDEIDPAVEAKMDAARAALERANAFNEEDAALQGDEAAQEKSGPPPIAFEPPVLDFGIIPPGQHITGTVKIRNTGSEPVTIEATRPSCQCTAVNMANVTILPGEAAPMEATFTQATLGNKHAAVRVKVFGYETIAEVPIEATVALAVLSEPAYIQATKPYGATMADTHGEIVIRSLDEKPFRILAIDGKPPTFVDFDPQFDAPKNRYTVAWDTSDIDPKRCTDSQGNPIHRWWVVETDHPDCPVFDIQVRHECTLPEPRGRRNWIVSPPRILLGELHPGQTVEVEGSWKWVPHTLHDEALHAVLTDSTKLKVELVSFSANSDEDRFVLRVTVNDNAPEGMLYETVRLHSEQHKAPLLLTGRIAKN